MNKHKGFTIVELVIVIAVIAILATVLVPTFGDVIYRANQVKDIQTAKNMNTALSLYSATISGEPMLIANLLHLTCICGKGPLSNSMAETAQLNGHSLRFSVIPTHSRRNMKPVVGQK